MRTTSRTSVEYDALVLESLASIGPSVELEPTLIALAGDAETALRILGGSVALRVRTRASRGSQRTRTFALAFPIDEEPVA